MQFHWWDFSVRRYVETAFELDRLRRAGKIARLGVTNFDTARLGELVDAGFRIAAHQLQYSLVDDRPADLDDRVVPHSRYRRPLLRDGVRRFLVRALARAARNRRHLLDNRSLTKYKLIIEDFGGWGLFQELLALLGKIAARRATDIASVATRAMLDRPQVAAAIVGATNTAHLRCSHANRRAASSAARIGMRLRQ